MTNLVWKDIGVIDGRSPEHHEHEAKTDGGDYLVSPTLKLADGKFVGYLVQRDGVVLGQDVMSLAEAKALAQADHDRN